MAEQPVTRYATGSGSHIAYQVLGRGPAIVIVPGFASHLELEWEDRACRSFIRRLAAFATVVRFDKRGTGLSDPVRELPTLEERDADLAAVIAEAGAHWPVLFGYSEGGPIAVRFAVAGHGSVRGLVLYGTAAHRPPPRVMEQLRAAVRAWGTGASIALFAPSQAGDPAARQAQARFERASASPAMARDLVESLLGWARRSARQAASSRRIWTRGCWPTSPNPISRSVRSTWSAASCLPGSSTSSTPVWC